MPARSTVHELEEWPQIQDALRGLEWQDERVPLLLGHNVAGGKWREYKESLRPFLKGIEAIRGVCNFKQRAVQGMQIARAFEPYVRMKEQEILRKATDCGIQIKEETIKRLTISEA